MIHQMLHFFKTSSTLFFFIVGGHTLFFYCCLFYFPPKKYREVFPSFLTGSVAISFLRNCSLNECSSKECSSNECSLNECSLNGGIPGTKNIIRRALDEQTILYTLPSFLFYNTTEVFFAPCFAIPRTWITAEAQGELSKTPWIKIVGPMYQVKKKKITTLLNFLKQMEERLGSMPRSVVNDNTLFLLISPYIMLVTSLSSIPSYSLEMHNKIIAIISKLSTDTAYAIDLRCVAQKKIIIKTVKTGDLYELFYT